MWGKNSEPEFVNLLRRPGIDSQPGGPVRQPYMTYRPFRLHRLAKSIPWNRFVDSLNVHKLGLKTFCCAFPPLPRHLEGSNGDCQPAVNSPLIGPTLPLAMLIRRFFMNKQLTNKPCDSIRFPAFLLLKSVYSLLCELNLATLYL